MLARRTATGQGIGFRWYGTYSTSACCGPWVYNSAECPLAHGGGTLRSLNDSGLKTLIHQKSYFLCKIGVRQTMRSRAVLIISV